MINGKPFMIPLVTPYAKMIYLTGKMELETNEVPAEETPQQRLAEISSMVNIAFSSNNVATNLAPSNTAAATDNSVHNSEFSENSKYQIKIQDLILKDCALLNSLLNFLFVIDSIYGFHNLVQNKACKFFNDCYSHCKVTFLNTF
jgi:hypothetical protein